MSPVTADRIQDVQEEILAAVENDPQWEERPQLHITDYGKQGDRWTVEVIGEVAVEKLPSHLKSKAEPFADNGFCNCTETYFVAVSRGQMEELTCMNVVYSARQN